MTFRWLFGGLFLVCSLGYAQPPKPCISPNEVKPKGTSYYNTGNPCLFNYRVPQARQSQLLSENRQCRPYGPVEVNCSSAVTGNYGQVQFGPGTPPAPAPAAYVVPSKPPPLGVQPAQQATAEQLWQQGVALVNQNRYRDAVPVLMKAANMGHPRAQANLGILFQDGKGVKVNDQAAVYWFSAAAAQGHRAAEYALGGMYEEGEGGLPKDLKKATELYIKSANQGFDRAQMALGIQYELGQEVPRSRSKALELLRASKDQDALWIAQVLANPKTPPQFASEKALDHYLGVQKVAEMTALWARTHPGNSGTGGMPRIMSADEYNLHQWKAGGEYGPRPGSQYLFHSGPQ